MLPKAVLSFVGRLVGIAAVLVSPLAMAAAAQDAPSSRPTVARPSTGHGHRHKTGDKKAKKRGSRHAEAAAAKGDAIAIASDAEISPHEAAPRAARPAKEKPAASRCDDAEVTTERASAKIPPKQSTTPLATLAAATTKPLIEPISTKAEIAIEPKGHAAEPRRTPIIRASLHTKDASVSAPPREKHAKPVCMHAPVDVTRGTEEETFPLTRCDGSALPHAVEEMSILVRPGNAAKPSSPIADGGANAKTDKAEKTDKGEIAPGIKKIDERLVERLQLVLDHFARPEGKATTPKVFVVSGYRPTSKGSFHASGRAIDFRVDGVENTDLVAFCKTLPDTGCGFYPNSSFIHLDVRDAGSGHVSWIDASGPGEKPEYLASWPPPPKEDDDPIKLLARLDDLQLLPPPGARDAGDADKTDKADKDSPDKKRDCAKPEQSEDAQQAEPASMTRKLEDQ